MRREEIYQYRRHNKNLLMVHLIFVTKYRKKIFFNTFKENIKQYIFETAKNHHWYIKRIETDKDHLHILLQYNPTDSITDIVRTLKQYSTHLAWKNHSYILKEVYWKNKTLWSSGYFAASVGCVSKSTIEHYIENQG